jgi:hypothetical protein
VKAAAAALRQRLDLKPDLAPGDCRFCDTADKPCKIARTAGVSTTAVPPGLAPPSAVAEHWAAEIIKTSWPLRRIAIDSRDPSVERADPVYSLVESLPKTLNEWLFVHIREFHFGAKRASGWMGGMRDAGAERFPVLHSLASPAAGALFEV